MIQKFVVGIIGKPFSGKGTVSKLLTEKFGSQVHHVMFSAPLTAFLLDLGYQKEKIDRPLLQREAQCLNKHFGEGTVTRGALLLIKNSAARIDVVDGVRWPSDFEGIKSLASKTAKPLMVYVHAEKEKRFKRAKERGQRAGEAELTWEEFLKQDSAANEIYVPELGAQADFAIDNNEDDPELKHFRKQIDIFCEKYIF